MHALLQKLAASAAGMSLPKSRRGSRSMCATTLLWKE